jgi:hypothetical protein
MGAESTSARGARRARATLRRVAASGARAGEVRRDQAGAARRARAVARGCALAAVALALCAATLVQPASAAAAAADAERTTGSGSTPPARAVEPPLLGKPAPIARRLAPTHGWRDGSALRPLSIDSTLRADFTPRRDGGAVALRASEGELKDVPAALQSPVLRDETGRARALPGGVVVVLAEALGDEAARALLAGHGASGARRVGPRTWLVPTAPGLASLEAANRLADTGAFVAAQPNWWVERTPK